MIDGIKLIIAMHLRRRIADRFVINQAMRAMAALDDYTTVYGANIAGQIVWTPELLSKYPLTLKPGRFERWLQGKFGIKEQSELSSFVYAP